MTGMVAGALIVNFASHHTHVFHEIEHIQWPLMIVFFILAGASLELGSVKALGLVGLSFIALRVASRLMGGWIGAYFAGPHPKSGTFLAWLCCLRQVLPSERLCF
jgi:Kef-type K+ transport system membrane component KefB